MPEENVEETLETTPAVESPEPASEPAPAEQEKDLESLNKQLYMRAKKAEEKAKELEKMLKTEPPKAQHDTSVDAILEIQRATRGLDEDEVAELRMRAKATGKSLLDARKDENFLLWKEAREAKIEKQKTLEPSSRQSDDERNGGVPGPKANLAEIEEYWTNIGLLKKRGTPPPPSFTPRA
jgi:hypothetical protein